MRIPIGKLLSAFPICVPVIHTKESELYFSPLEELFWQPSHPHSYISPKSS